MYQNHPATLRRKATIQQHFARWRSGADANRKRAGPLVVVRGFWHLRSMRILPLILCSFFALASGAIGVAAQSLMTAQEFEDYTQGKTLYYGNGAEPYGAEIYLPNRRVRWSFLDGQCIEGEWYEADGLICFTYEDRTAPQCWSFEQGQNGLIARFENNPAVTPLYEATESTEELLCLGPEIGV